MSKLKRKEFSLAKDIIYPSTKFREINKMLALDNELNIKIIQEINRERRTEKINQKDPEPPFKLERFKNIASKYLIPNQQEKNRNKLENIRKITNNSRSYDNLASRKPYNIFRDRDSLRSSNDNEENVYNIINSKQQLNISNEDSSRNNNMQSKNKKRNYILENRLALNQLTRPVNEEKRNDIILHKNFGKTPNYIEKYKQEAEEFRQEKKKQEEEAKYPPGTKLVKEEDRIKTLRNLEKTKEDLIRILEKLPVSNRSSYVSNQRMSLWKQLEEIEENIRTFSKRKVFIKEF